MGDPDRCTLAGKASTPFEPSGFCRERFIDRCHLTPGCVQGSFSRPGLLYQDVIFWMTVGRPIEIKQALECTTDFIQTLDKVCENTSKSPAVRALHVPFNETAVGVGLRHHLPAPVHVNAARRSASNPRPINEFDNLLGCGDGCTIIAILLKLLLVPVVAERDELERTGHTDSSDGDDCCHAGQDDQPPSGVRSATQALLAREQMAALEACPVPVLIREKEAQARQDHRHGNSRQEDYASHLIQMASRLPQMKGANSTARCA